MVLASRLRFVIPSKRKSSDAKNTKDDRDAKDKKDAKNDKDAEDEADAEEATEEREKGLTVGAIIGIAVASLVVVFCPIAALTLAAMYVFIAIVPTDNWWWFSCVQSLSIICHDFFSDETNARFRFYFSVLVLLAVPAKWK